MIAGAHSMEADAGNLYEARFAKEVDDLRMRHGITLDDLSAGEVAAFVHAVERVCSPFSEVNAELAERPILACRGVWLWPPTAGAQIWLDEYAAKWWPKGTVRFKWAQVYALRNARDPYAFTPLTSRLAAESAIALCALRLSVHARELQYAVSKAYGVGEYDAPPPVRSRAERLRERLREQAATDFASMVARLEVQSGIPRNVWLWERSLVYTATAYASMHEFAAAFSAGGGSTVRMIDELDDALRNLARVKSMIVLRVNEDRAKVGAEKRAEAD